FINRPLYIKYIHICYIKGCGFVKVSSFLRAVCTILIFLLVFFLSPFHINIEKNQSFNYGEFSKARVTEVIKSDSSNTEKIKVIVKKGKHKGEEFIVDNTSSING
ncbi:hypothetical protein KUA25_26765, partial [Bacteroidales bacterium MSK.15.36]|nr:hypothetical protein [Bacteroidales bacterium MSK.15.36]